MGRLAKEDTLDARQAHAVISVTADLTGFFTAQYDAAGQRPAAAESLGVTDDVVRREAALLINSQSHVYRCRARSRTRLPRAGAA